MNQHTLATKAWRRKLERDRLMRDAALYTGTSSRARPISTKLARL